MGFMVKSGSGQDSPFCRGRALQTRMHVHTQHGYGSRSDCSSSTEQAPALSAHTHTHTLEGCSLYPMLPLFALSQSHQRFVARTAHWPLTQNSLTSSSEVRPCHLAWGCGVCLPGPPLIPIGSAERGGPKWLLELRVGYSRSRQRASALTLMTTHKKNTLGERVQMASQ